MANMVNNGRAFMVVQKPDWNGGHYFDVELPDYQLGDFEYELWYGTPKQFAEQLPSFTVHVEPFHEEPYEEEYTSYQTLLWHLNNR